MSAPNISAMTSQLVCDLRDHYPTKAHNITPGSRLKNDPLDIYKKICNACFQTRIAEKQSLDGLSCAYEKKNSEHPHTITSGGLKTDPFDKSKKICPACFRTRIAEKQSLEGLSCAYKYTYPDKSHNIKSGGLRNDPFDTTTKICHACYETRLTEKKRLQGLSCAYQEMYPEKSHNINTGGLKSDPLDTNKKICRACYETRLAEKKALQGLSCAYKETYPEKSHNIKTGGLKSDPLDKTNKICCACYKTRIAEKHSLESLSCTYQETYPSNRHTTPSGGLRSDRLDKTKKIDHAYNVRTTKTEKRNGKSPSLVDSSDLDTCEDETNDFQAKRRRPLSSSEAQEHIVSTSALELLAELATSEQPLPCTIKNEDQEQDPECSITAFTSNEHRINNTFAILQDPKNPHRSLLSEVEAPIDALRVTRWNGLDLTRDRKQHVLEQIKQWLYLNETDRLSYAEKLEEYCDVAIAIDEGPNRGRSVFAKKDIEALTVIGPYSGILRQSDEELQEAISQNGSVATMTYLFATRSSERSIDALHHGNVTSLVNTGSMPGYEHWAENNIVSIVVGKNLIFYVTKEKINKGQELLLDYGPTYNPYQYIKMDKDDI